MGKGNKFYLLFIMLFILIYLLSIQNYAIGLNETESNQTGNQTEQVNITNLTLPYIEPEVINQLNQQEKINVIIYVYNRSLIDESIVSLPANDSKFIKKMQGDVGFVIEINKKALDLLLNNTNVKSIFWDRMMSPQVARPKQIISNSSAEENASKELNETDVKELGTSKEVKIKENYGNRYLILSLFVIVIIIIILFLFLLKKRKGISKYIKLSSIIFLTLTIFFFNIFPIVNAQNTGSVSGKVIPNDTSIVVQVIQNLAIVAQTNVSEDGSYRISGLPEGRYGLLFIWAEVVYIYNTEYPHLKWIEDNTIRIDKIEFIDVSAGENLADYNINLDFAEPHFVIKRVILYFEVNISKEEREGIVNSYNLSILDEWHPTFTTDIIYTLEIPKDKTALEIARALKSVPKVKSALPDTVGRYLTGGVEEVNGKIKENFTEEQRIEQPSEEIKEKDTVEVKSVKIQLWLGLIIIFILIIITFLIQKYKK